MPLFYPKIVRFMEAFIFEQWKGGELQELIGLKGNVIEWRYGYIAEKFVVHTR